MQSQILHADAVLLLEADEVVVDDGAAPTPTVIVPDEPVLLKRLIRLAKTTTAQMGRFVNDLGPQATNS
jgi:hypothetical protein